MSTFPASGEFVLNTSEGGLDPGVAETVGYQSCTREDLVAIMISQDSHCVGAGIYGRFTAVTTVFKDHHLRGRELESLCSSQVDLGVWFTQFNVFRG